jgi:hypothetical protein
VVNDVYQPYLRPRATEKHLLRVARGSAVGVAVCGVVLVPVFAQFKSIYSAHGAMTAAVTPPLVVALLCSVFWRRYTRKAALLTLVGGGAAIVFSLFVPEVIAPFTQGVPMGKAGEGILGGMTQFKFMRALFGLGVSAVIAVAVTMLTRPEPMERQRGLVWGTVADALKHYKGSAGTEQKGGKALARIWPANRSAPTNEAGLPRIGISRALADRIDARAGDLLYISDARWWLGGLYSAHVIVGHVNDKLMPAAVELDEALMAQVATRSRVNRPVRVERLY